MLYIFCYFASKEVLSSISHLSISEFINCALRVMNKNDRQSCRTLNKQTEILLSLASNMYCPPKWRLMLSKYTLLLVHFFVDLVNDGLFSPSNIQNHLWLTYSYVRPLLSSRGNTCLPLTLSVPSLCNCGCGWLLTFHRGVWHGHIYAYMQWHLSSIWNKCGL